MGPDEKSKSTSALEHLLNDIRNTRNSQIKRLQQLKLTIEQNERDLTPLAFDENPKFNCKEETSNISLELDQK